MTLELVAFALVGLLVGSAAAALPRRFASSRALTVATATVSGFVVGVLAHTAIGYPRPLLTVPTALIGSALLTSLLARKHTRSVALPR
ncbi:hypothetical protein [Streptacidiphilus monticola]|uniref:Integral membrane protein n=1 Tax=Streptacidiphilus monticola TaxID=2161674 RepID=A0ABW1G1B4_9ACTN